MSEHIERCFNVANGWFHTGKNDGERPYNDIVTPIIDVAFRSEGFDVKDIIPYVENAKEAYKSFFIKKRHPQWARKHRIDSFIDEVVETSIIYDLVLVKKVKEVRPEVVKLQSIAFCDQTDVLSGPIAFKHQYSVQDLMDFKGVWNDDKIDEVIVMARASKEVSMASDREAKTPGKYIEVYELHGRLPESWLEDGGNPDKYVDQLWIVNFYTSSDGSKNGITLFKGKSKPMKSKFKALKIDTVRSHGRACGRSIVERLFEPQVWNNYSGIKLKKMLDSAVNLLQTDSEEFGNKNLARLPENTILKHEPGRPITRVDMGLQNVVPIQNLKTDTENQARTLGSASEASLGKAPVSGTPFALQDLIVQEGEGIHEYRRGKVATFFSDELYQDWILDFFIADMNKGIKFSEEFTLDELQEYGEMIANNMVEKRAKEMIISGKILTQQDKEVMKQLIADEFVKGGSRKFMETLKDELSNVPVSVFVNVAGKQRYMRQNADKISKLITTFAGAGIPLQAMSKSINQLLEESGMSAIDFRQVLSQPSNSGGAKGIPSPYTEEALKEEELIKT